MSGYKNCPDGKGRQTPKDVFVSKDMPMAADSKKKIKLSQMPPPAAPPMASPEEDKKKKKEEKRLKKEILKQKGPLEEDDETHRIPGEISSCGVEDCKSEEMKMMYAPNSDIKKKNKNLIHESLNDLAIDG